MADNENVADGSGEGAEKTGMGKKKLFIIIGAALAVVLGVSFGAYTYLKGDDTSENSELITEDGTSAEADDAEKAADKSDAGEKDGKKVEGQSIAEAISEQNGSTKEEIGFGETYKLAPFSLNLANLENHYIRVQISLEYSGGEAQKKELEVRTPQLRDAIINIIGSKTKEFLLAPDGKDALRKEILIRMNRYMKTKIDAVYITDIIIE